MPETAQMQRVPREIHHLRETATEMGLVGDGKVGERHRLNQAGEVEEDREAVSEPQRRADKSMCPRANQDLRLHAMETALRKSFKTRQRVPCTYVCKPQGL